MLKKYFLFFMMILLIASGCTGVPNDSASNGEEASNEDQTVIKYWSNWNEGEPQQQVMNQIITDYEKENPNVDIEVEWLGRDLMSKVRNAVLSEDGPDIIDKNPPEIKGAIGDQTESLENVLSKDIPNEEAKVGDVFLDGTLDLFKDDDKLFFIPYQLISSGFFYNKTLLEAELGLKAPETWDEFIEISKQIKNSGLAPLAQDGSIGFYNAYYYYWLSTRINGAGALNEAASDETGEVWDDPGFLEAATKVEELVSNDFFIDGYEGSQFPAAQTRWAQGDAALILNGTWIPQETGSYASNDFEYEVFPFPKVEGAEGDNNSAEVELIGWAAPSGSNVEVVSDFIAFGMQKKYHEQIVAEMNNISTRKDVEGPENLQTMQKYVEEADSVHVLYDNLRGDYPEWWNNVFLPINDKLVFGEISAVEFIEEMKEETIKYWN
ncbi:ABC transporter substrate-binding protein [Gracilibacillus phocaeensis]|uniref:ABC transporter substrate-binding protein n=1 Tax=Gracilibacillus phocaeensis TaxID=2042304 RepID=UPI0010311518|nr:ABC transporter substrate-binding protein [Gracilibacillus phocaeensis]